MPNTSRNGIVVKLQNGEDCIVRTLLSDGDSNAKLAKSNKSGKGYLTFGLSLAPASTSGFNVCAQSSEGCRTGCLFFAGHGTMPSVMKGRTAKTLAFFQHKTEFLAMLGAELEKARAAARRKGLTLAVRLNVLSDLPWERIAPELFARFADVQFYDYTKVPNRTVPANYHLTFSRSETNEATALAEYARGINVAVVFSDKVLPKTWNGLKVHNGDETDLRFLDKRGIVGLYAKGRGRKDTSGFIVPTANGRLLKMAV
jgi:hypothetical protein